MMKKRALWLSLALALSLMVVFVFCTGMAPATAEAKGKPEITNIAKLPKDITRIDFIHRVKGSSPSGSTANTDIYKLMGAKWPTEYVPYYINYAKVGDAGALMNDALFAKALSDSAATWDDKTGTHLFAMPGTVSTMHYGTRDNTNVIEFGLYPGNTGVIAVTSIWYSKSTKTIYEFDMLFNTYYKWGDAMQTTAKIMDLQDIATHELGHAIGLADIYTKSATELTMYGYASYNEIKKRDLAQGDINGLQVIYGQ
jgi:hypothetical protein